MATGAHEMYEGSVGKGSALDFAKGVGRTCARRDELRRRADHGARQSARGRAVRQSDDRGDRQREGRQVRRRHRRAGGGRRARGRRGGRGREGVWKPSVRRRSARWPSGAVQRASGLSKPAFTQARRAVRNEDIPLADRQGVLARDPNAMLVDTSPNMRGILDAGVQRGAPGAAGRAAPDRRPRRRLGRRAERCDGSGPRCAAGRAYGRTRTARASR